MYRDASNYKKDQRVVIDGRISFEDAKKIFSKCEGFDEEPFCCGDYERELGRYIGPSQMLFIPEQVGLPVDRFKDGITEDDHCYCELQGLEPTYEEVDWTLVDAKQLVSRFETVDRWHEEEYTLVLDYD
ncbi:MAG: hypothetical protein IKO10_16650 [Lachnospiraceae bacterium]|nr:hypothetical protein [Lachnospiraceae bacterium]